MPAPILIPDGEIELAFVRAQGAGGQNVNKVSSAVHLRFDIIRSSLPDAVKTRLLALRDQRIARDGVIHIKAQQFRSQELNRKDALRRLHDLVNRAARPPVIRRPTKPTPGSKMKRLESKVRHGYLKAMRRKTPEN